MEVEFGGTFQLGPGHMPFAAAAPWPGRPVRGAATGTTGGEGFRVGGGLFIPPGWVAGYCWVGGDGQEALVELAGACGGQFCPPRNPTNLPHDPFP